MSNTQTLPVTLGSLSTSIESLLISVESISQSIGKLVTREEFKNEISKLPTRDEMNIAISDSFDELARMVAAGFKETNGMVYQLQSDFNGLQGELHGFRNEVHGRFDSFEETVATNHGHRLRRIETKLQLA